MLIALLALCAAVANFVQPEARTQPRADQRAILESMQLAGPDVVWLLLRNPFDDSGELVDTSNAGATWRSLPLPAGVASELLGFELIDARDVVLRLKHGLAVTHDGGTSWRAMALPAGLESGQGAYFLDQRHGWYLASGAPDLAERPASMWATADAGAHWSLLWSVSSLRPVDGGIPLDGEKRLLGFRTPMEGWMDVIGLGRSVLLSTLDGGATWSVAPIPENAPAVGVHFFPPRTVLVTLDEPLDSAVIRSDDAGVSWDAARRDPPFPASAESRPVPAMGDPLMWFVPAGRQILETLDGGTTWHTAPARLPSGLRIQDLVWLPASGRGYGVARDRLDNPYLVSTTDWGRDWSDISAPELSRAPVAP